MIRIFLPLLSRRRPCALAFVVSTMIGSLLVGGSIRGGGSGAMVEGKVGEGVGGSDSLRRVAKSE